MFNEPDMVLTLALFKINYWKYFLSLRIMYVEALSARQKSSPTIFEFNSSIRHMQNIN